MLNKAEAADYLKTSTRTIERHVKSGKLSVRYEQGQFGEVAMFSEEELKDFQEEKQTPRIKPATIETKRVNESDLPNYNSQITYNSPLESDLFNPQQPNKNFGIAALITPISALFSTLTNAIENHESRISTIEIRNKLLLSLDEAQTLTGLSRDILQSAIKNGELPSKMMGKSYRIKTQDLEVYIQNLEF